MKVCPFSIIEFKLIIIIIKGRHFFWWMTFPLDLQIKFLKISSEVMKVFLKLMELLQDMTTLGSNADALPVILLSIVICI